MTNERGGRPKRFTAEQRTEICNLYLGEDGHKKASIYKIAKTFSAARQTIKTILNEEGVYQDPTGPESPGEEDGEPSEESNPDNGNNPPSEPPSPSSEATPPAVEESRGRINEALGDANIGGTSFDSTEIGKAVKTLKDTEKNVFRAKQQLGIEDRQPPPTVTLAEAQKMCTDAGFKVEREDKMSIKEAEQLLKDQGYNIQPSQYTYDAVKKLVLEEKGKWEEGHNIELEKVSEDQKISAAESVINNAVNRVVELFQPAVQEVMGAMIDKKQVKTKKAKEIAKKLRGKPKPRIEPIEITAEDIDDEEEEEEIIGETFEAIDHKGEKPEEPSKEEKKEK